MGRRKKKEKSETSSYFTILLTTVDIIVVCSYFTLILYDLFTNTVAVATPSLFMKIIDGIDFNLGFRGRKIPKLKSNNDSLKGYDLNNSSHSNLQAFYVYSSAVAIKYLCGMLLNLVFFGIPKAPFVFDVLIFNLCLLIVQFSYNDMVYRRMTTNLAYSFVHYTGVSVLKVRKVSSLVAKTYKFDLNPTLSILYVILAMEFTGTFRSIEPILYHMSFKNSLSVIDKVVFDIFTSFDTFISAICAVTLIFAKFFEISNFISWTIIFSLLFYRWQRKLFKKYLALDLDQIWKDSTFYNKIPIINIETDRNMNIEGVKIENLIKIGFQTWKRFENFLKNLRKEIEIKLKFKKD